MTVRSPNPASLVRQARTAQTKETRLEKLKAELEKEATVDQLVGRYNSERYQLIKRQMAEHGVAWCSIGTHFSPADQVEYFISADPRPTVAVNTSTSMR